MKDEDLPRLRVPRTSWPQGLRCACCKGSPTCPMLHDEVWAHVWGDGAKTREAECTCPKEDLVHVRPHDWSHTGVCEIRRGVRALLCMECAEQRLGRQLTLEDLSPCVGNYSTYLMVVRALEKA